MAKINPRNAHFEKVFGGFGGLLETEPLSGKHAMSMANFRVRENGILESRKGYQYFGGYGTSPVRGFWEGTVDGKFICVAVNGTAINTFDPNNGARTAAGTTTSQTGRVRFFLFRGELYLVDGEEIKVFTTSTNSFISVKPYIPLYGKQWDPVVGGLVHEPMNLLTNTIRVNYANSSGGKTFQLPFYVKSVDSVRVNRAATDDYQLSSDHSYITITSSALILEVDVMVTVDLATDSKYPIMHSTNGYVHTGFQQERLLLCGSDNRLYHSAKVTDAMLFTCRGFSPYASPLYFKERDVLLLGDNKHPVHAFCPHYDGVLAMSSLHSWLLQEDEDEECLVPRMVLQEIGAPNPDAIVPMKDGIAVIGHGNLKKIHSLVTRPADLESENIPLPTDTFISDTLYKRGMLFWNIDEEEIWLRDPQDANGTVWVMKYDSGEWYRFENIKATLFFRFSRGIGFGTPRGELYFFDNDMEKDYLANTSLLYESGDFDFEAPAQTRRSLHLSLSADLNGQTVEFYIQYGHRARSFVLKGKNGGGIENFSMRVPPGRHRFLRFGIRGTVKSTVKFYKLICYTNL